MPQMQVPFKNTTRIQEVLIVTRVEVICENEAQNHLIHVIKGLHCEGMLGNGIKMPSLVHEFFHQGLSHPTTPSQVDHSQGINVHPRCHCVK
jgi:hypothetical protein